MRAVTVVESVGAGHGVASGIDDGKVCGVRAIVEADDFLRHESLAAETPQTCGAPAFTVLLDEACCGSMVASSSLA